MKRKIVNIDEEKCTGCGLCAQACHEGAIVMSDGKAKLIKDDYCDGLGDCLPACPADAIKIEEREAAAYDEAAVAAHLEKKKGAFEMSDTNKMPETLPCGCPGTQSKTIDRGESGSCGVSSAAAPSETAPAASRLNQWPVQIKLVPVNAPYFENADLLIAADCTAYAYGNFHNEFIKNRITLIGCPKLDEGDYSEKLTQIITDNNIKSVTVVRMEVPCCGGIEAAAKKAIQGSGKFLPWQVVTVSSDGRILE